MKRLIKPKHRLQCLLLLAMMAGFGLFFVRLFHLQVLAGRNYRELADENRFFKQTIPAERGVFLDRYGQPLVFNKKFYYQASEAEKIFTQREHIARDQALRLMATDSAQVSYELRRAYQFPWSLAHVLGYTSPATKEDLIDRPELGVTDWVGKMGLESYAQDQLTGKDGYRIYEIDTMGEKQRVIEQVEPTAGSSISTNLDPYLSQAAYQALGQNKGSVVILDAHTGEVLALVNKPAFNSNDLSYSLTEERLEQQRQQNIQNYFSDENKVFFNRAVSGTYAPGSVFKLVTALAGLDSGKLDLNTTVVDDGILEVNDYQYANWYYTQYGRTEGEIGLKKAIARSNDIFFYKAAEWVGPDELAQQARNLGFGQMTEVELPAEASGLVPDPEWKEQEIGERWYLGNTYHFGIGQGDMLVTPLQVAQLVQAIVNQGEMCQPQLYQRQQQAVCRNVGLQEEHLDTVLTGMVGACSPGGTAFPLFKYARQAGIESLDQALALSGSGLTEAVNNGALACKTGTAEFGGLDQQGYRKTHGWLAAVANIDQEVLQQQAQSAGLERSEPEINQIQSGEGAEQGVEEEKLDQHQSFDRANWLQQVHKADFPEEVVIVVLVESDQNQPFKEGSEHAGPVAAAIVDWLRGE